jgi:phosphopantetheinyl transferase
LSLSFDACSRRPWPFFSADADTRLQCDGDIEVHLVYTNNFPTLLQHEDALDETDWADISRQQNRDLRRRAIAARVLLRHSLSKLVSDQIQPSQWRFVRTSYGKLLLAANGQPQIHFSIAHTRGASAIAISKSVLVGIDIEAFDSEIDHDALKTGLSPREQRVVDRLDIHTRSKALLKLWTLKEACTKLVGVGHSAHLPAYEFLADPAQPGPYRGTEEHTRETRLESWVIDDEHGEFWVSLAAGSRPHSTR